MTIYFFLESRCTELGFAENNPYYTLNVRSRRKQLVLFSQESWCFPRGLGKHQDSWENKTNWFPEGPDIKYFVIFPDFHFNVLQQQQKNTLNSSESTQYDSVLMGCSSYKFNSQNHWMNDLKSTLLILSASFSSLLLFLFWDNSENRCF